MAFLVLSKAPPLVALLGFPNITEKEKGLKSIFVLSSCNSFFSFHEYYLANPNSEGITNHIANFHDNPTVNTTKILVLLRRFWVSVRKETAMM